MKPLKKNVEPEEVKEALPSVHTSDGANVDRLQDSADLLCHLFGINEDYTVTGFVDKGTSVKITMNSKDFEVTVVIKDPEKYGLANLK